MNQFILGNGGIDPILGTSQINSQLQYLESQKQLLMSQQKQLQEGMQQVPQQSNVAQQNSISLWDSIDSEIEPLTIEQQQLLNSNEEYVNNYNTLQQLVQVEVLNLVRTKIENSEEGKALLSNQLKLVKSLKTGIIEKSQRDMELFKSFQNASSINPALTYDEFIKSMSNGTHR